MILGGLSKISSWSYKRWLLFWFAWSLLVSGVYWFLGPYSYIRIQDTTDFNLAYRIAAAKDFLTYGITYWQPKFAGGMPAWVMPQYDSFLITGPPFYLLPPWAAYGFIMWLQRFVAGYFTYRLCRSLGLNTYASLFAGVAFSLNNWTVVDWTLFDGLGPPATPLYLLLFDRFIRVESKAIGLLLVGLLGVFLALVASSALYTIFLVCGLPVWFLYIRGLTFSKSWQYFLVFICCAVLMELPGVIGIMSFVGESSRSLSSAYIVPTLTELFARFWFQLKLATSYNMLVYSGLALLGMTVVNRWDFISKRLLILLLVTLVGAEVLQFFQVLSGDLFPPVKGNLRDFNQFSLLFGVLVGASGLHLVFSFVEEHNKLNVISKNWLIIFFVALALTPPLLALKNVTEKLASRIHFDNYQINFESPTVKKLFTDTKNVPPFRVATMVSNLPSVVSVSGKQFYPGYTFAYGFDSTDGYFRMYSMRSYRYWLLVLDDLIDQQPIYSNFIAKRRYLFTPKSYALTSKRPKLFFAPKKPIQFSDWYNIDLLSLNNTRFILSHWPLRHPDLKLIYEPVAEQKIRDKWAELDKEQILDAALDKKPPPHALYVYENERVLPRVFLAGEVEQFADADTLLASLNKKTSSQLLQTVLLQDGALNNSENFPSQLKKSTVTVVYPHPDRVEIKSQSDAAAILVLTDNYDKYWRVWVDGVETKIFPVYHMFRGVELKKGSHEITMEYWPPYRLNFGS
ncbi:MAG: YfhO family protein [Magnetococcales bacterium]|nr:YfhO family protein [Magnetococcales bacterium]